MAMATTWTRPMCQIRTSTTAMTVRCMLCPAISLKALSLKWPWFCTAPALENMWEGIFWQLTQMTMACWSWNQRGLWGLQFHDALELASFQQQLSYSRSAVFSILLAVCGGDCRCITVISLLACNTVSRNHPYPYGYHPENYPGYNSAFRNQGTHLGRNADTLWGVHLMRPKCAA